MRSPPHLLTADPVQPLAAARASFPSSKLSNLQRLSQLSSRLDFHFPETYFLSGNHFVSALLSLDRQSLAFPPVDTLSDESADRLRELLLVRALPSATRAALASLFRHLAGEGRAVALSVRSCFAIEDAPSHSFAGAFETVLSVTDLDSLYRAVQVVYASVFSRRALADIRSAGLSEFPLMSVAIQRMVGGEGWRGGVAHTQCPDLVPFPLMLLSVASNTADVTAGEGIPEDYLVSRRNLDRPERKVVLQAQPGSATRGRFAFEDQDIRRIATVFSRLEEAFETPLEIEWACDPQGSLHLLQARPFSANHTPMGHAVEPTSGAQRICTGLPVGSGRLTARARLVSSLSEADHVPPGHIVVAYNTDPDWVPVIRRAAGLVTAIGARTSHVSRAARDSGILAVVGCGEAIQSIEDNQRITLVCAEGVHGGVYSGALPEDALTLSTEEVRVRSVSAAFSLGRSCRPRRVYFDLSDLVLSYRLPDPRTPTAELPPRLLQRIAGHADVASFVLCRLTEAVSLLEVAFPNAEIRIGLHSASPFRPLLPSVAERCLADYGVRVLL